MAAVKNKLSQIRRKYMGAFQASILLSVFWIGLCGCGASLDSRFSLAEELAARDAFVKREFHASPFYVTAYLSQSQTNVTTGRIYIEGDGLAWLSKSTPSLNPTPIDPYALRLTKADRGVGVDRVYLARPCQYSGWDGSGSCPRKYWTTHRYAPEVVKAYRAVVDRLKIERNWQHIEFVGYSGGATLALLLAHGRSDVVAIRTVAGNLDIDAHSRHHNVSLMPESINPAIHAEALSTIPQYHFVGGKDKIVPRLIAKSYMANMKGLHCAAVETIDGLTHGKGWTDLWPRLLLKTLPC